MNLLKEARKYSEDQLIQMLALSRAAKQIERLEKEKQLSEDEAFAQKKEIDEEVKEANRRITELAEEKKRQLSL